jgi:hypothetical protein
MKYRPKQSRNGKSLFLILVSAFFLVSFALNPASTVAMSKEQKRLFSKNIFYYDLACSAVESGASTDDQVSSDLSEIVEKNGGFSAAAYTTDGELAGEHKGDDRPAAAASTLKLVIVHAALELSANVDREDIKAALDIRSDNDAANRIIEAGGLSKLNDKIQSLGYGDTQLNNKFSGSPVNGGNKTSAKDIAKAMVKLQKGSGGGYETAKDALKSSAKAKGGKDYWGNSVAASKWGGTSDVSSVSVLTNEDNGSQYIISVYVNAAQAGDKIKKIVEEIQSKLAGAPGSDTSTLPCACPGGAGGELDGENNAVKVYNYLIKNLDLTPAQVSGIIGNLMNESGSNTYKLVPDIVGHGMCDPNCYGIAQWSVGRTAGLRSWAKKENKDPKQLATQAEYIKVELEGAEGNAYSKLKGVKGDDEGAARTAAATYDQFYERSSAGRADREANAVRFYKEFVKGQSQPSGGSPDTEEEATTEEGSSSGGPGGCSGSTGDAELKNTITVDTPGKFITLPAKYGCGGSKHRIDSRIAAGVAYLVTKYNMCVTAGLEDGHNSHGAGLAIDAVPKDGTSPNDWKSSTEEAARAIGWYGDSATDPKGSKKSCANYGDGDYGQCMHEVYPDKFPKWMRWMGYNGAHCHGDKTHIYGGCGAHLHIGWASPNGGDAVSSSEIGKPIPAVYTFEAPIPDDLKGLVE